MAFRNQRQYEALAFHTQFERGRVSGILHTMVSDVTFKWASGQVSLPLKGMQLKLGGASKRLVFISHSVKPEWTISVNDPVFLKDPTLTEYQDINQQIKSIRKAKGIDRGLLAGMVAIILAMIAGVYFARPWLMTIAVNQIPPEWEVELGKLALNGYEQSFVDDEEVNSQLMEVTGWLLEFIPDAGYPFEFHVVEDSTLNAFALPGGVVVIHSGTILASETPEELLGVLAHEIAHVTGRHGLKAMVHSLGTMLLVKSLIGDSSALFSVMQDAAPFLLQRQYSRDHERDADQRGLLYLDQANIDPRGMLLFFEKMQQREQQIINDPRLNVFRTHPTSQERIGYIRDQITATQPSRNYRSLGTAFKQLKARVEHINKGAISDEDNH